MAGSATAFREEARLARSQWKRRQRKALRACRAFLRSRDRKRVGKASGLRGEWGWRLTLGRAEVKTAGRGNPLTVIDP